MTRYLVVEGAGFIGSHPATTGVTVFDNFTSGREWHMANHRTDGRFAIVRGDAKDTDALTQAATGHDTVIHLTSNPDVARAVVEPDIDFREGRTAPDLGSRRVHGEDRGWKGDVPVVRPDLSQILALGRAGPKPRAKRCVPRSRNRTRRRPVDSCDRRRQRPKSV